MTTDNFAIRMREQARHALAATCNPEDAYVYGALDARTHLAAQETDGGHGPRTTAAIREWTGAWPAAQEPTDAEVEALARMTTEEVSGCDWARFGEESRNYHRNTARRRLTAARAARRDEQDRP